MAAFHLEFVFVKCSHQKGRLYVVFFSLLASGSDDFNVIIWDPFRRKQRTRLKTGHTNNIFSVKFLPHSEDRNIVSGAGDFKIRVHDVVREECTQIFGCHLHRVKRLAVSPTEPSIFWSAAEDGLVLQFDLRVPHTCGNICDHVLLNLNSHVGPHAEAKCISLNPCRPELIAVGTNDPYVRVFDRRMLSLQTIKFADENSERPWERYPLVTPVDDSGLSTHSGQYYVAGHLSLKNKDFRRRYRPLATTYLTFSPDGSELLVNLGGEQIYLFNINARRRSILKDLHKFASKETDFAENVPSPSCSKNGFQNGYVQQKNGHVKSCNGSITSQIWPSVKKAPNNEALAPRAELLKQRANSYFEKKNYTMAISLYSEACLLSPTCATLFANRAVAYMKRNWDGDIYAGLRDSCAALQLDPDHLKANFRLTKCLFDLKQLNDAEVYLRLFKSRNRRDASVLDDI